MTKHLHMMQSVLTLLLYRQQNVNLMFWRSYELKSVFLENSLQENFIPDSNVSAERNAFLKKFLDSFIFKVYILKRAL